jgi:argininosuccinate lyase
MQQALTVDVLGTEVADYLVKKGVSFRQTHHLAGAVIKRAEDRGTMIDKLSLEDLKSISESFEDDIVTVFDFENCVEKRSSRGGTSKASVAEQIRVS